MGEVWDAAHLLTGRPVALKLLHPSLNARPNMRKRLLREARAATAFAHPNVIEVFDVFELADGTPVIVMELLRGQTLRERLDRDRMADVEEACGVMVQVVSAVGTGHAHGVIHRDIKPENVMLCASGVVKVMDFGVAKLVHADPRDGTSATAVGAAVGTIGYMAPEQACGEEDIDHRADIWSVGAVLYEAIAGRRPVPGSTLGQIIAYQLTDRPAPLCDRAPEIPRELGALVDRMLEREPRARPADLREVHLEMARHTQVVAPSFGPPAPTSVRDHEAERELAKSLGSAPTILGVSPAPRRGT
jgi:serine/threonine protein kinase